MRLWFRAGQVFDRPKADTFGGIMGCIMGWGRAASGFGVKVAARWHMLNIKSSMKV